MHHPYINIKRAIPANNANALAQAFAVDWSMDGRRIVDDRALSPDQLARMRNEAAPLMLWPQQFDSTVTVSASGVVTQTLFTIPTGFFTECIRYLIHLPGGGSYSPTVSWMFLISGRPLTNAASSFYGFEYEDQPVQCRGGDTIQLRATNSGGADQDLRIHAKITLRLQTKNLIRGRS